MKADIFLHQAHVMRGNVKFVASVVFDDEMFLQFCINLQIGEPQITADAVLVVDNVIAFLNVDEIIKRNIRGENILRGTLFFVRQDNEDFVLPDGFSRLRIDAGNGADFIVVEIDTYQSIEVLRENVKDASSLAEFAFLEGFMRAVVLKRDKVVDDRF